MRKPCSRQQSRLYLGLGAFIATSVAIGVIESCLALTTTYREMDYIARHYMRR